MVGGGRNPFSAAAHLGGWLRMPRTSALRGARALGEWRRAFSVLTMPPPEGYARFRLQEGFLEAYASREPAFGFNGLGKLVYERTYARPKANGDRERWHETVERVVNGTFNMQKLWIERNELGWDEAQAQASAQDMYTRIFDMKFLPPGRGLWAMGSPITEERRIFAALNNCAFVSTADLAEDFTAPFTFLMEAAMLGVGVGFDTKGAGTVVVRGVDSSSAASLFTIPDSREGWVESLRLVLASYVAGTAPVVRRPWRAAAARFISPRPPLPNCLAAAARRNSTIASCARLASRSRALAAWPRGPGPSASSTRQCAGPWKGTWASP